MVAPLWPSSVSLSELGTWSLPSRRPLETRQTPRSRRRCYSLLVDNLSPHSDRARATNKKCPIRRVVVALPNLRSRVVKVTLAHLARYRLPALFASRSLSPKPNPVPSTIISTALPECTSVPLQQPRYHHRIEHATFPQRTGRSWRAHHTPTSLSP